MPYNASGAMVEVSLMEGLRDPRLQPRHELGLEPLVAGQPAVVDRAGMRQRQLGAAAVDPTTTDNALAVQIHGGYGYSSEYLPEAWLRDQKLNSIHEGTTQIQALDLLGRKVIAKGGEAIAQFRAEILGDLSRAKDSGVSDALVEPVRIALDRWLSLTERLDVADLRAAHLDGDRHIEREVAREVDGAEPPFGDDALDLVLPREGPTSQSEGVGIVVHQDEVRPPCARP